MDERLAFHAVSVGWWYRRIMSTVYDPMSYSRPFSISRIGACIDSAHSMTCRGAAGVPFEESGRPDITFRGDSIHLEMRPILTYKLMLQIKYFDALNVLSARRKGCGARGKGE